MKYFVVDTSTCYLFMKKSFQFVALVSFASFLYSYLSGFPFFYYYNIQFSTLIFPLFAQALRRKYMFLICNAILAFLAKNVKFSHSTLSHSAEEDQVKQLAGELPPTGQENIASMEMEYMGSDLSDQMAVADEPEMVKQLEKEPGDSHEGTESNKKTAGFVLESAAWEYDDDEDDNNEDDEEDELKESRAVEATEQVTDARVSTEELNKKFEEFIRKMKEEIRIEAQQPLIEV